MFLTSTLIMNIIFAQENDISDEQWKKIVDYANTKVTLTYIDSLHNATKLNQLETENYENILKPQLINNSLSSPISFESLKILMTDHFGQTLKNLSAKIDNLKYGSRDLDSLFSSIESAFKAVKMEKLDNSSPINNLRSEIIEFTNKEKIEVVSPINNKETPSVNLNQDKSDSILTIPNIIILLLIIVLSFFIFLSINKHKEIEKLKNKIKNPKNHSNNKTYNNLREDQLNRKYLSQITNLENKIAKLKTELKEAKQLNYSFLNPTVHTPSEIIEQVTITDTKSFPESSNFYAGKPTPEREFISVNDHIKEQETIFKFTIMDSRHTKASFEVIIVNDFMMRQIINSPDDFLYRVCNNVNSNQDFRKEIITERKGIAHFKNGIWVVDENDKALIKFH